MAAKPQPPQPPTRGAVIGRWAVALALLGGLIGSGVTGVVWLAAPSNVPLERVRIDGDLRHTRRELLQRTLAGGLRGSFFSLDLDAVREAVESLPWITRASVRRVWPGTLVVHVEEREALARWGDDALVSPLGEVFKPDPGTVPNGLAGLSGPPQSVPEVVERYTWMRRRLAQRGLDIARLQLSGRHAWSVQLGSGLWLYLGNRDLERRLERFLLHFRRLDEHAGLAQVDLRYTNGFAVRPRPAGAEEQETGAEG
jgi:cell division protein FtsQ